jgi:thioredoxin-related protein
MKRIFILTLILGLSFLLGGDKEPFTNLTLDEAISAAQEQGKGVVVKFHADWCHYCNKMDREVFTDQEVQDALKAFLPVKINVETGPGRALARKFGIYSLPTILIFNSEGKRVYQQPGFHNSKQLIAALGAIRE